MSGFSIGFELFIIWCAVQSGGSKEQFVATKTGQCPTPPTIPFATYFAEWYVLGTKVYYECENGFTRQAGTANLITCKNQSNFAQWTFRRFPSCVAVLKQLPPEQLPTENVKGVSKPSEFTDQQVMNGLCRAPSPPRHATGIVKRYLVGQRLIYKCLAGGGEQNVSTCVDDGAGTVWSCLTLQCSNGTNMTEVFQNCKPPVREMPTRTDHNSGTVLPTPVWLVMTLILLGSNVRRWW